MTQLNDMTQDKWNELSPVQKRLAVDNSALNPQLIGLEGWRVEVVTSYDEKRRFIVGKSTGWRPCHLEVNNRRSMGGVPADGHYKSVRALYQAR